jgi:hypothetical protein
LRVLPSYATSKTRHQNPLDNIAQAKQKLLCRVGGKQIMKSIRNTSAGRNIGLATLALAISGTAGMASATTIRLNGQPLATSAQPITLNGRTLVPMRDIFEALGAQVNYNPVTRGISALRASTKVDLQIGNRTAAVNNIAQTLDQAPILRGGVTFVPLRFVSTAMGANVRYNSRNDRVVITTDGFQGRGGLANNGGNSGFGMNSGHPGGWRAHDLGSAGRRGSRNAGSGSLVRHGTRGPDVHCDRSQPAAW